MVSRGVALAVSLVAVQAFAQWPRLDQPLPKQGGGENDSALIISVGDYAWLPDVPGANDNARAWYLHLAETRGVKRVKWLKDNEATREQVVLELKVLAENARPGGVVWVVYIGHGAVSAKGDDGVLVGAEAQQVVSSLYARSVAQKEVLPPSA